MAQPKPIGEQMAAFNTSDDTSFAADRSNGLLNSTCPARIQSTSDRRNRSLNESTSSSSGGKWQRRPKREPIKISPLEQIDEMPPARKYGYREKHSDYKTRLCVAFRRQGFCPYYDRCTYAHGDDELRIPSRRPSSSDRQRDYSRESRDTRDSRGDSRESRSRRDNNDGGDSSFSRGSSSSRWRDENRRYPSTSNDQRQICRSFERGNCRFGPRCRYIHLDQMQQFNANATVYAPPSDTHPMAFFPTNGPQIILPPMSYFIPQQPQYVQACDINQTMPIYHQPSSQPQPPMGTTYYLQPMAPTPVMDQSAAGNMVVAAAPVDQQFPEGFFSCPPPLLS